MIVLFILLMIFHSKYRAFNYRDINSISYGSVAKLKWNQVKAIYNSNPKRWRFDPIIEQGITLLKLTIGLFYSTREMLGVKMMNKS